MRFHDEQLQILKELFIQQKANPTEETFFQILQRVDRMLAETISKFSRIYYYQESLPQLLQDLYQTGIVGIELAIQSYNPDKGADKIPIWIFYCVRNELFKVYGIRKLDYSRYMYDHPNCLENPGIDAGLIREDVQRIIKGMVDSLKISEKDIQLITLRYIKGMKISEILKAYGDRWGTSRYLVKKRIDEVMALLKEEFEEKGMGDD